MKKTAIAITYMIMMLPSLAIGQTYIGNNCPNNPDCLNNPYGAGSPYAKDGFNNPYSSNGSPYSNESPNNPYATNPPKLVDQDGGYHGRLSKNPYLPDSTSNSTGKFGSPYSPDSINNPNGAGSPYNSDKIYVVPQ